MKAIKLAEWEEKAISYQLSAISYQLSAISYQLSAISYQLLSEDLSEGLAGHALHALLSLLASQAYAITCSDINPKRLRAYKFSAT
ncbi:hypothetical protein QTN47_03355 [Danxiaibacter flavus]|uniref:HEPN domain-containing protein n=1 Tax=Danxiaibacter flavus TaxID=3049108 RepID=A0ABV3Z9I6_9BACT|nr:hypothetical protein QNM32_03355 [Chitinophagaceae bacterium DXS]